jgi:hypothetical protein
MHFFRYRNERLIDMWHVWDVPALMRQLGVPAPEVKAERVA